MNRFFEMREQSESEDALKFDPNLTKDEQTPMVHYYRAEIGRLVVYKQRMDTTVYWLLSFSLFIWSANIQGWFTLTLTLYLSLGITFFLQLMDINRYKSYHKIKFRCRIMEEGMYTCIFDAERCQKNWKELLVQSWTSSRYDISSFKSFLLRFRNIFIYFYICNILFFILLKYN